VRIEVLLAKQLRVLEKLLRVLQKHLGEGESWKDE
jgi:hypothetical protein